MKVLIIGSGQLAWDLIQTVPQGVDASKVGRGELDITQAEACVRVLNACRPDVVINGAAYTAVDKAESDRDAAFLVNEQGTANLAVACRSVGARLFHVSTDFVFDGQGNRPYRPGDAARPLSVYGASKLAGEQVLREQMPDAVIVRTGWLYSCNGGNFVKTMLRLMVEKPELRVVSDQIGTPTWAKGLALLLWSGVLKAVPGGLYHWSDAGVASWYDFTVAIQDIAVGKRILDKVIPIRPISTSEFPMQARRPAYSVLDKQETERVFQVEAEHWWRQLGKMFNAMP